MILNHTDLLILQLNYYYYYYYFLVCHVPDTWPTKGEITFENVSLRYVSQREPVISNLSLKIPAGQKVEITKNQIKF